MLFRSIGSRQRLGRFHAPPQFRDNPRLFQYPYAHARALEGKQADVNSSGKARPLSQASGPAVMFCQLFLCARLWRRRIFTQRRCVLFLYICIYIERMWLGLAKGFAMSVMEVTRVKRDICVCGSGTRTGEAVNICTQIAGIIVYG